MLIFKEYYQIILKYTGFSGLYKMFDLVGSYNTYYVTSIVLS